MTTTNTTSKKKNQLESKEELINRLYEKNQRNSVGNICFIARCQGIF